jgi:methylation protein EvaC
MPCKICGAACEPVIDFGLMPIANGFLAPGAIDQEKRFPLAAVMCPACAMVQLTHPVPAATLFPPDYVFHSSTSTGMATHFEAMAASVSSALSGRTDPLVVEIGSNDGIMLQHIARAGIRHVGIEPAAHVADIARARGVHTISQFFDAAAAEEILRTHGPADAIVGANVLCHMHDLDAVVQAIASLLKPDGFCVFEDPYLGDILDQAAFDQIYDEHVYYFSLASVQHVFGRHGFEVRDAVPQRVHGGSMRYVIGRGSHPRAGGSVAALAARESRLGVRDVATYTRFRERVQAKTGALTSLVATLRADGKRVVGYAATSKSTTAIVHCGFGARDIEYICDTTPGKVGRVSPGAHIPIRSHADFTNDTPDFAVLFAWNHRGEVLAKEQAFLRRGGRFIVYVPDVAFIDATG